MNLTSSTPVVPFLFGGPLYEYPRDRVMREVCQHPVFGPHIGDNAPQTLVTSLDMFVSDSNAKHFDPSAFNAFLILLEQTPSNTFQALTELSDSISMAISTWQDALPNADAIPDYSLDNRCDVQAIDNTWHSAYKTFTESSWGHLAQFALRVHHLNTGVDGRHDDANGRFRNLNSYNYSEITKGYDLIMRNALAHGQFDYGETEITYRARAGVLTLRPRSIIQLVDCLGDTIAAMIAAIQIFLVKHHSTARREDYWSLPRAIKLLIVRGFAARDGLDVNWLHVRSLGANHMVHAQASSDVRSAQGSTLDALIIALTILDLYEPDLERISVTINCGPGMPPLFSFTAQDLRHLRCHGTFPEGSNPMASCILSRDEPDVIHRARWFLKLLPYAADAGTQEFRERMEAEDVYTHISYEICSVVNNVANWNNLRLNVDVYIPGAENLEESELLTIARRVTRRLMLKPRAFDLYLNTRMFQTNRWVGFPKHIWMRLHSSCARPRALRWRAWEDDGLIAEVEWRRPGMEPIQRNMEVEDGRLRLRWHTRSEEAVAG